MLVSFFSNKVTQKLYTSHSSLGVFIDIFMGIVFHMNALRTSLLLFREAPWITSPGTSTAPKLFLVAS